MFGDLAYGAVVVRAWCRGGLFFGLNPYACCMEDGLSPALLLALQSPRAAAKRSVKKKN